MSPLAKTFRNLGPFLVLCAVLAASSFTCRLYACGASAGSGGVSVCTLKEVREKERLKWRLGSTYGYTNTTIVFTGGGIDGKQKLDQRRQVFLALLEWRPKPRFNLVLGAGSLLGGTMQGSGYRSVFDPGAAFSAGAGWVVLRPKGAIPFVLLNAQMAVVTAATRVEMEAGAPSNRTPRYSAFDLRIGASAGYSLPGGVSPYALARVFGGPVSYSLDGDVTGTDLYHYQAGLGVSLLIDARLDFYVEGSVVGERGLNAGLGFAF